MNADKRSWLWPVLLAVTIFTLSGASRIATPDLGFQFSKDKVAHVLVFGLLATSILRVPWINRLGWHGAILAVLITVGFGGFDELRQSFTPGRSVEFADWLADTMGAITAVIAYRVFTPYQRALEWRVSKLLFRKTDHNNTEPKQNL